jgi:tripartite-type tricarboxylate transporter receptor subunit TctC
MKKVADLLRAPVFSCVALLSLAANAQFPTKPITLVMPYQAGSSTDGLARSVAAAASVSLGQPVVVDNKPGADGLIACSDVAKAAPDGYRILFGTAGSLVAVPALRKSPPYDAVKDFSPLAGLADFSHFIFVNASLPAKNMAEFISYVKANPGKVNYGTGNNIGLLTMAYLTRDAGLDMLKVPYKGEPAALIDLLANRVQVMSATALPVPHAKSGALRALVTTLPKRIPLLPDVPTMQEVGLKDIPFGGGWVAFFGPAGMPKDVVDRLSKALIGAIALPVVQARMDQYGLVPSPLKPEELAAQVKSQAVVYADAVRELKLPLE